MPASVSPGTAQGGRPLRPDRSPRPATPSSDTMSLHLRNVTRGGEGGSIPLLGDRCWVPELRAKGSTHENTLQPNLLQGILLRSWLPGQDASRIPLAAKYPVRVGVPTVTVLIKPIWRGTRSQTQTGIPSRFKGESGGIRRFATNEPSREQCRAGLLSARGMMVTGCSYWAKSVALKFLLLRSLNDWLSKWC